MCREKIPDQIDPNYDFFSPLEDLNPALQIIIKI